MSSCYWFYSGYVIDVIFLPIYNNLSPKICCDNHSKVKKFEDLTTCHLKFIVKKLYVDVALLKLLIPKYKKVSSRLKQVKKWIKKQNRV